VALGGEAPLPRYDRVMRWVGHVSCIIGGLAVVAAAQLPPRTEALLSALRPALPFPAATPAGDLPASGGAASRWFVVWPSDQDDMQVIVRANPLHPETQEAATAAMRQIHEAILVAERKAQTDYDRAMDALKRTGRLSEIDGISLDDEGVAGERIDAELELTIELVSTVESFTIASSEPPAVTAGRDGVAWIVSVPANVYREDRGSQSRERFRAAESRVYFGTFQRPTVNQVDESQFTVTMSSQSDGAFGVVLRGNDGLLNAVLSTADWARLAGAQP
jgi:hypothetical protein